MKSNLDDFATTNAGRPRLKRYIAAAAIVILLLVGSYFGVAAFAARLLRSDRLLHFIASRTGHELDGNAALYPLSARGYWIHSLGMVVTAQPPRALTELRAFDLSASFSLLELWRGKWRLGQIDVRHFQAAFGPEAARLIDRKEFGTPELVPPAHDESIMSVDIRKVSLARADLFWGDPQTSGGQIRGAEVNCFPDGKNLTVHGRDGTYTQAKWPQMRIDRFKLYYAKPALRIDEGRLTLGEHGTVDAVGQFRFEQNASVDLQLKFAHCPIAPFVSKQSQNKFDGTFVADAHVQKSVGNSEALSTTGSAAIESALLKNVEALVKVASFTGDKRLNPLRVNEARADYRFESDKLSVRDFHAESRGVLCAEGNFTYTNGDVDGRFELGVAPEIVAKFPGAREEVFTREEGNYLWTTVNLSGPLEHPKDDLKPRLLAAIEKHVALHLLAPLLKPAQGARDVIEGIFPK